MEVDALQGASARDGNLAQSGSSVGEKWSDYGPVLEAEAMEHDDGPMFGSKEEASILADCVPSVQATGATKTVPRLLNAAV